MLSPNAVGERIRYSFACLGVLTLAFGCGSSTPQPGQTPAVTSVPAPDPVAPSPPPPPTPAPPSPPAVASEAPNEPPGFEIPAYEIVGVGQEIGFGLEVIDEEQDVIRVELVEKPASATYDPYTLTVVWKPTRADLPAGNFAVRVTETRRDNGEQRVLLHRFAIAVSKKKQPELHARPLGPVVETLITIHDPERLADVNKRWPLDATLLRAAELQHELLPEAERAKVARPDKKVLYRSFLKQLARAHDNPRVHPESKEFDEAVFGNPKDWKIIAVRPRLDKKWHEIRIVYKAEKAHAATYAMFRFRPVADDPTLPPEAHVFNNKEMSRLVFEAFFRDDGILDPRYAKDMRAHGKRVTWLVNSVLRYEDESQPWAKATFLALPMEARLGGGSVRGADGKYQSGDGWAWNVMKVKPQGGVIEYVNVPIKGFVSKLVPSEDGTQWAMACGSRFDPTDDAHNPGSEVLCRPTGHTDLPGTGDGYSDAEAAPGSPITSAFVDAANMFVEHKRVHIVASAPLRDPRRDLFEEKGMTCHQCHVRKFGVRDMYDRAAYDPTAGTPKTFNKKQATTYFVIVPTVSWQPYAIDFQHKQECKFAAAIEVDLGKKTSLTCPLKGE